MEGHPRSHPTQNDEIETLKKQLTELQASLKASQQIVRTNKLAERDAVKRAVKIAEDVKDKIIAEKDAKIKKLKEDMRMLGFFAKHANRDALDEQERSRAAEKLVNDLLTHDAVTKREEARLKK